MANTVERYVDKANFTSVVTKIETKLQNRYTKAQADSAIANAIAGVTQFDYEIPEGGVLPQEGEKGVIYLIPNQGTGSNLYNEYIWIVVEEAGEPVGHFELFGSREIDISGKLENSDVKVNTSTLTKTNDQSGNGFTVDLSAATKASLALADSAVQDADLANFLVGSDVKVDGTTITKTPDVSGNGFTLSSHAATTVSQGTGVTVTHTNNDYEVALSSATQTSLGLADSALQPGDVEPLSTSDVNDILAILTDDTVTP